jgi:inner membrane protein
VRPPGRPTPLRPLPDVTFRRLLVVSLVLGSNLPDVDLLYSSFAGGPLGYVLQHRGYTHTLLGALGGAVLLWFAVRLWLRYRGLRADVEELAWIGAACVIGVLLHLGMDYTNNYGVHPFWPFYDGWVYGDSVFILEPLLWLAAAPLIFVLQSTWARALVALALGAMTLAVCVLGLVATPAVIVARRCHAGRGLLLATRGGAGLGHWPMAGRECAVRRGGSRGRPAPGCRSGA